MNVAQKIRDGKPKDWSNRWRLFDLLCEHPYGLTVHELIAKLYTDEDGGPLKPDDVIRLMIHEFNKCSRKALLGLYIRSSSRHGGAGYRFQIWITK